MIQTTKKSCGQLLYDLVHVRVHTVATINGLQNQGLKISAASINDIKDNTFRASLPAS